MLPVSGCCQCSGALSCLCWSPNDPSLKKSMLLAVAINVQQLSQLQKEHLCSCPPQAGHSTYSGASPHARGGLGGKGSRRVLGLPLEPSLILNQGMQRGSGRSQGEITELLGLGVLPWAWRLGSVFPRTSHCGALSPSPPELFNVHSEMCQGSSFLGSGVPPTGGVSKWRPAQPGDTHNSCSFWQKLQPSRLIREMELLLRWSWCRAVRP